MKKVISNAPKISNAYFSHTPQNRQKSNAKKKEKEIRMVKQK